MSTTAVPSDDESPGFPELTPLGKQLEVLRIGRGISKQYLARYAGTSRQQLWRVMTGKSELTDTLRQRLAQALGVDTTTLAASRADATVSTTSASAAAQFHVMDLIQSVPLETYLATADRVERTLRMLPNGDAGRELKRTLLNALEDQAVQRGVPLAAEFFDLRRRIFAGEL
jgi:transcriptional regulator with XRE-family HTH domain